MCSKENLFREKSHKNIQLLSGLLLKTDMLTWQIIFMGILSNFSEMYEKYYYEKKNTLKYTIGNK